MEGSQRLGVNGGPAAVARIEFDVSDVEVDTSRLPTSSTDNCWWARLSSGYDRFAQADLFSPEEIAQLCWLEACSDRAQELVPCDWHPVMEAVHLAFQSHRPLCLSPDIIWLLIVQGLATHVTANAAELRRRIVAHDGRLDVAIRRDDLRMGDPDCDWQGVVDDLYTQVGHHVGPATSDLLLPRFSTTTPVHRVAAQIAILDAMQRYFSYKVATMCGIPRIFLEGTEADWQALSNRVAGLAAFDLEWWVQPLTRVLDEFVAAARGRARPAFWQSIYKRMSASGGPRITGWINAFFPYICAYNRPQEVMPNPCLTRIEALCSSPEGLVDAKHAGALMMDSFPSGLSRAPFQWTYFADTLQMELVAGFAGIHQEADTGAIRPEIGWAVAQPALRDALAVERRKRAAARHAELADQANERARSWSWKAMCPACGIWTYAHEETPPGEHCGRARVNVEYRTGTP